MDLWTSPLLLLARMQLQLRLLSSPASWRLQAADVLLLFIVCAKGIAVWGRICCMRAGLQIADVGQAVP